MPYSAAGVEYANSGGISILNEPLKKMNLKPKPPPSRMGWNMQPPGDNKTVTSGVQPVHPGVNSSLTKQFGIMKLEATPSSTSGVQPVHPRVNSSLTKQFGIMKLEATPSYSHTGLIMPPAGDNKKKVRGGKSKRNNSRKKIRKNRRTNKTRRSKK